MSTMRAVREGLTAPAAELGINGYPYPPGTITEEGLYVAAFTMKGTGWYSQVGTGESGQGTREVAFPIIIQVPKRGGFQERNIRLDDIVLEYVDIIGRDPTLGLPDVTAQVQDAGSWGAKRIDGVAWMGGELVVGVLYNVD